MRRFVWAMAVLLSFGVVAVADVASGPEPGSKLEPMTVYAVVGEVQDEEVDYTETRKDKTTVYAFVQREYFSRPIARFLRTLDGELTDAADDARMIVIFLGDDPDAAKEYMPRLQTSVSFQNSDLTVFTGDKSGPNNWGINPDAHLTVVVTNGSEVSANFPYETVNETDVRKVKAAVAEAGKQE